MKPQITQLRHPPHAIHRCLRYPDFHVTSSHSLFDGLQPRTHKPMHLEQDTTPPSPTRGLTSPAHSQSRLLPLPQPGILSLRSKPHTALPPAGWSPRTRHLRARQRRKWEEVKGYRQGPQKVSYAIKAAVESWSHLDRHAVLGSRGRAGERAGPSCQGARAPPPRAAPALPLAGAARVPMQMSRAGRGRERARRGFGKGSWPGGLRGSAQPLRRGRGRASPGEDWSASRGIPTRRVAADSWVAARKPVFPKAS